MFDEEDLREGTKWPTLGPAYFDARKMAERIASQFEAEHFKPLIDKMAEDFREKLWDDVRDYLLADTESNIQSETWRMVDNCVEAILGGHKWAMEKYALGSRYDCDKIRQAVAQHIPQELQDKRVADLEAEVEQLKKDLAFHRRNY